MKKVDMSEATILSRLKQVDQLRELCLSLMKAKKAADKKSAENQADAQKSARENKLIGRKKQ